MMWGYYPNWDGMFLMMLLGNILWIVLLSTLIWAAIRWLRRGVHAIDMSPGRLSAMEILRQRYARGEIDAATFEQMRACLGETRVHKMAADFDGRQTPVL
jgi:putative membrane protein